LVVPEVDAIVVGLSGEHGCEAPETLHVNTQASPDARSLRLPDRLPLLVEIRELRSGLIRLSLDDDDETELVLRFDEEAERSSVATPSLILANDDGEYRLPIYSEAAETALAAVRAGLLTVIRVDFDPLTVARLRSRIDGAHAWTDVTFGCDPELLATSPVDARKAMYARAFAAMREALARNCEIELDLGSFGRLSSQPLHTLEPAQNTIRLTSALRSRIRWLTQLRPRLAGISVVADHRGLATVAASLLARVGSDGEDRELLSGLSDATFWPRALLAHVSDLATQLRHLPESLT
jgi:hypothetical protein